ncbi:MULTISPECIES: hypothetical protein [unclassified Rathayibacter]|uniref:hypothetical protein n=1 Tax=unclassified Rathayibacter TaxID=2609250 RepID=UPI0006FD8DD4|nr:MULTISPECIES: hypothetical protein [unclassified Rathayibacter]KQQ05738.1 hypothetical protein ASF42_04010 [Rathayibacter sp. Leaf294]KQS13596.1 hypothetical protein ASG06_04020 [Rathayibacter sp. Leaf185]
MTLEQKIAAARAKAAVRRTSDALVIVGSIIACITVVVPWLIGRWPARDTFFRTNGLLFDTRVRGDGDYFLSDWMMGCAIILLVVAAFLLLRPWSLRAASIVFGFTALAAAALWLIPASSAQWNAAEQVSYSKLTTTAYPWSVKGDIFSKVTYSCGSDQLEVEGALWQVHTGQTSSSTGSGCNMVAVYRGWQWMGSATVPDGESIDGVTIADDTTVSVTNSADVELLRFPLSTPPTVG